MVCISPLTSLMIDQRAKFQSLSVKAELVGEARDDKEVEKKVIKGEYQLVFTRKMVPITGRAHSLYFWSFQKK